MKTKKPKTSKKKAKLNNTKKDYSAHKIGLTSLIIGFLVGYYGLSRKRNSSNRESDEFNAWMSNLPKKTDWLAWEETYNNDLP